METGVAMECILCLEVDNGSGYLRIHSPEVKHLNIQQIVDTHFWIRFATKEETTATSICQMCWDSVASFHEFYTRVKQIHDLHALHGQKEPFISNGSRNPLQPVDLPETATVIIKEEPQFITEVVPIVKRRLGRPRKSKDIKTDDELPITETLLMNNNILLTECNTANESIVSNENNVAAAGCAGYDCNEEASTDKETAIETQCRLRPRTGKECNAPIEDTNQHSTSSSNNLMTDPRDLKSKKTKEHDAFIAANYHMNCCLCQQPFDNFTSLKSHFRIQHKIEGYAVCCKKKFLKRSVLVDHIHTHIDPLYFKCPRCCKVLSTRWYLETHLKAHDDPQERNFNCAICSKSFLRRASYMQHVLLHVPDEEKNVACAQCNKTFATTGLMNKHLRTVHMNVYAKICDVCGKSIRGREAFRRHQEEHSGVQHAPIECTLCGNTFSHKYGLARHMKAMHTVKEKRPQVCRICSKVSPSVMAHMGHMKYMHRMKRKHECPMCRKAFKTPKNLREHITTHTGEILYTCTYCPKKFNSNANMYSHRKKAHRFEWEKSKSNGQLP